MYFAAVLAVMVRLGLLAFLVAFKVSLPHMQPVEPCVEPDADDGVQGPLGVQGSRRTSNLQLAEYLVLCLFPRRRAALVLTALVLNDYCRPQPGSSVGGDDDVAFAAAGWGWMRLRLDCEVVEEERGAEGIDPERVYDGLIGVRSCSGVKVAEDAVFPVLRLVSSLSYQTERRILTVSMLKSRR